MAKKWNEKVQRREEKLFEVNRLAILDCCEKFSMDYLQLRKVFENLPPVEEIVENKQEWMEEIQKTEESTSSLEQKDLEVDSSFLEENPENIDETEEQEEHDETME